MSLGIVKEGALKNYLTGVLWGAGLLFIIYLILFITGHTGRVSINGLSIIVILLFFGFIIQGASEEFLMRGYFMNSIAARSNIPFAVIINSVVFMVLHLANPGVTFVSMLNILIFGIIFSLLFLLTENIFVVSGMHFFWNFALGGLLGSNVSGMEMKSVFVIPLSGSEIFSGGDFGIEGSLITTFVGCLLIAVLIMGIRRKPQNSSYTQNIQSSQ